MLRIVARLEPARADDAAQVALAPASRRRSPSRRRCRCPWRCRRRPAASAGASLMPSPAIATTRPSACSRRIASAFCSGSTSASTSSMPSCARDRLGRRAAVAGQHHDAQAVGVQQRAAPRRVDALIGSATPSRPASAAVDGDEHHRLAVAAQLRRPRSRSAPASTPERRRAAVRCRARRGGRRRVPRTPLPVMRLRSRRRSASATPRSLRAGDDRRGQRMLAGPLEARGEAQQLVLVDAGAARPSTSRGLPSVSVPVLSTTSVSTFSRRSSASALRISTPAVRAAAGADHDRHRRRQPERAGAGDDQHRDGVDQRVRQARLGADQRPRPTKVTTATSEHGGHEPGRRRRRPAAGSARGCAAPRRPSARSARAACRAPTRSARITKLPVPLTVPPVTLVAGRLLDRDRLAGDHRFVDGAAALEHDAVDRHLLAGPHAQPVARRAPRSSGTSASLPSARDRRARRRREAEQRADRAAGAGCARAARAPGRAAPASTITAAASK